MNQGFSAVAFGASCIQAQQFTGNTRAATHRLSVFDRWIHNRQVVRCRCAVLQLPPGSRHPQVPRPQPKHYALLDRNAGAT